MRARELLEINHCAPKRPEFSTVDFHFITPKIFRGDTQSFLACHQHTKLVCGNGAHMRHFFKDHDKQIPIPWDTKAYVDLCRQQSQHSNTWRGDVHLRQMQFAFRSSECSPFAFWASFLGQAICGSVSRGPQCIRSVWRAHSFGRGMFGWRHWW